MFILRISICIVLLLSSPALSQVGAVDRGTDLLVMVAEGTIDFDPQLNSVTIDQASVSTDLLATLQLYNAREIIRAIPDFDSNDLTRVSPDGRIVHVPDMSRLFRLKFPAGTDLDEAARALDDMGTVLYAERIPDLKFFTTFPNDSLFGFQWGLHNTGQAGGSAGADIDAPEAWDYEKGSASVKIGIIDSGVMGNHDDLSGKVSGEGGHSDPHGTHVAGIAGAKTDNAKGVAGVSWYSPIHAEDISGFDPSEIYTDIHNAVDAGCFVLNNSWGGPGFSMTIRLVFAYAYEMNRVSVVSMGNTGDSEPQFPAVIGQGVLAVGSIENTGIRSEFSSTGNHIDVVAPGGKNPWPYTNEEDILSTWADGSNSYEFLAGTSMAAPFATGLAALLKSHEPELDNDDVIEIIKLSGTDFDGNLKEGWDPEYGHGRINARKALDFLTYPFHLAHESSAGGFDVGMSSSLVVFIGVPGLADGTYVCRRYTVERDVAFSDLYACTPHAWGRGVWTSGYSMENPNCGLGWSAPVSGSITKTGCRMRTYVYEVWNVAGEYIGWVPCTPSQVSYAYSALGIKDYGPPDVTVTYPNGGEYFRSGNTVHITWQVDDEYIEGVRCGLSYSLDGEEGFWTAIASNLSVDEDGEGSYDWKIPTGHHRVENNCRVRVIANDSNQHQGIDISDADFTIEFITKPDEEPDPNQGGGADTPTCTYIDAPYPNPFNPSTAIRFGLAERSEVTVVIYDIHGKAVRTIVHAAPCNPGHYLKHWDGRNDDGVCVSAGIYFLRFQADGCAKTRKLVLVR